eukprot:SAG11_NODE_2306_length_3546_cov_2.802147_6_plen_126_part_00
MLGNITKVKELLALGTANLDCDTDAEPTDAEAGASYSEAVEKGWLSPGTPLMAAVFASQPKILRAPASATDSSAAPTFDPIIAHRLCSGCPFRVVCFWWSHSVSCAVFALGWHFHPKVPGSACTA